jgi:hypothetical protein
VQEKLLRLRGHTEIFPGGRIIGARQYVYMTES